jgi:hypothetical protein
MWRRVHGILQILTHNTNKDAVFAVLRVFDRAVLGSAFAACCLWSELRKPFRYYLGLGGPLQHLRHGNVMHNCRLADPGSRPYWVLRVNDDKATLWLNISGSHFV